MVTYAEKHKKLVAVGGCTPSGCAGCNGIHVAAAHAIRATAAVAGVGAARPRSACSRGCVKTSSDGGRSWSQIRAFSQMSPGGQINYDRVSGDVLLQFPSDALCAPGPHPLPRAATVVLGLGVALSVRVPDSQLHAKPGRHRAAAIVRWRWCAPKHTLPPAAAAPSKPRPYRS